MERTTTTTTKMANKIRSAFVKVLVGGEIRNKIKTNKIKQVNTLLLVKYMYGKGFKHWYFTKRSVKGKLKKKANSPLI